MGKGMQGVGIGLGLIPDPTQTHNLLSGSLSNQAQTASSGEAGVSAQTTGQGSVGAQDGQATSYQNTAAALLPSGPNNASPRGVSRFASNAKQIYNRLTGDLRTIETQLKEAEKDFAHLKKAFASHQLIEAEIVLARLEDHLAHLQKLVPNPQSHPQLQWMLGQLNLLKAKMTELTETSEKGMEFYQKALEHFNQADKSSIAVSSLKPKIIASRHEIKMALGDYQGAMQEEGLLALADPHRQGGALKSQRGQWEQRVEFLKHKSELLAEEGKLKEQTILLSEALRLEEALGHSVSSEDQDYLNRLALAAMSEELIQNLQDQVDAGGITPETLESFDKMAQQEGSPLYRMKISIKDWITLGKNNQGEFEIAYTDLLSEASIERRTEVLAALQELAVAGEMRSKAFQSQNPVEKAYFEGQVALLDGNIPLAKLKLHEVWQQKGQAADEVSQALVEAAGEQLRQFALAHIQEMKSYSETLYFDRHDGKFDDGDKRLEDYLYDNSMSTLLLLEGILNRGEAHTLEEALQFIHEKAKAQRAEQGDSAQDLMEWDYLSHFSGPDREAIPVERRVDSFLYNSANPEIGKKHAKGDQMATEGGDKYFYKLLQIETPQVWAKTQTEEGAFKFSKEVGDSMRGWGSQQIASQFYEHVMAEDMARYEGQVKEGVLNEANNIFTEKKLKEQMEDQLKALQEEDPGLYAVLYPKGKPSQAQRQELLQQVKAGYIEHRTKQEIFRILHQKGLSSPLAQEAWLDYRSMTDILDETGVISDAAKTAIIKESIITAITLPITMGAGQLVRNAILASKSKWVRIALGSQRFSKVFYYYGVLGAGGVAEGAVMELQHAALTGKFNVQSIGHNVVMTLAFHRMSKVWQAYSKHLGIDDIALASMKKSGKVWQARGLKALDTAGMLNLQTLAATIASDPENKSNIVDGYLGHFARNVGFHYGAAAMRGIAPEFMALEGKLLAQYGQSGAPWEKALSHYDQVAYEMDVALSKTDLVGSSEYSTVRSLLIRDAMSRNLAPEQVGTILQQHQPLINDIKLLSRLKELPREQQLDLLRQEGNKRGTLEAYFKDQDTTSALEDGDVVLLEDSALSEVTPITETQIISVEEVAANAAPASSSPAEITQVSEFARTQAAAEGETRVFDRTEDGKTQIYDDARTQVNGERKTRVFNRTEDGKTQVVNHEGTNVYEPETQVVAQNTADQVPMAAFLGSGPSLKKSQGKFNDVAEFLPRREGTVKLRLEPQGDNQTSTSENSGDQAGASTLVSRARLAVEQSNSNSEAAQFLQAAADTVNYWQGVFERRGIPTKQLTRKDIPEQYLSDYNHYQEALQSLREQLSNFNAEPISEIPTAKINEEELSVTAQQLIAAATSGPIGPAGENFAKTGSKEISVAERVAQELAREGQLTDPSAKTNTGPARASVGEETKVVTSPPTNPKMSPQPSNNTTPFNPIRTSLEMLANSAPPLVRVAIQASRELLAGSAPDVIQPKDRLVSRPVGEDTNVVTPPIGPKATSLGLDAANSTPRHPQAVGHGFMHDPAADISQIYFSGTEIKSLVELTPSFYLPHEIIRTEQGTYHLLPEALERSLTRMVHASQDPSRRDYAPYKAWIPRLANALRQQSYRNPALRGRLDALLEYNGYHPNGIRKDAVAMAGAVTDMNPHGSKGPGDLAFLGPDYQSLAKTRPSDVGKIQHLTQDLEKAFDRGAKVIQVGSHFFLVEPTAGAETSQTSRVTRYEAEAYQQWYQIHGFQPVSFSEAYGAWMSLGSQGIQVFYHQASQGFIYRPNPQQLNQILAQHGAQIVYLNKLLKTLPPDLLKRTNLKHIVLNSPRFDSESQWADYNPDNQSLSLYSGAFAGSRRHFAAVFLHELGHANAIHYPKGSKMRADYETIRNRDALFALDVLDGVDSRKRYQEKNFDEFLAELHLIYRVAGRELRAHIDGLQGAERQAWERVYREMEMLFSGQEYGVITQRHITAIGTNSVRQGYIALNADAEQGMGSMAAYTHEGIGYKPVNEDAVGAVQLGNEGRLVAVADGAGGHGSGDKASKVAVESALQYAVQGGRTPEQILLDVHQAVRAHPSSGSGMATMTLYKVSTTSSGERWLDGAIAGDAGLVIFRLNAQGEYYPEFISKDDGPVAEHFESYDLAKRYDPQDQNPHRINTFRRAHPQNNVIFNAVGGHDAPDIQSIRRPLQSGDVILAGSDGIFDNMSPYQVAHRLNQLHRRTGVTLSADAILATLQQEVETKMRRFNQLVVKNGSSLQFKNPSQAQTIEVAEPDYLGNFLAEKVHVVPYYVDSSGNPTHYLSRRGAIYAYDQNLGYYVVSDFIKLDNIGMSVEVMP